MKANHDALNDIDSELDVSVKGGITVAWTYNERQIILNLSSFSSRERIWVNDDKVVDEKVLAFSSKHTIQVGDEAMHILISTERLMTKIVIRAFVGDRLIFERNALAQKSKLEPSQLVLIALAGMAFGYAFGHFLG